MLYSTVVAVILMLMIKLVNLVAFCGKMQEFDVVSQIHEFCESRNGCETIYSLNNKYIQTDFNTAPGMSNISSLQMLTCNMSIRTFQT